ncbi:threonine--tRNA ligase [Candidatus Peregrinibacteria bacterium]|nr:threonine--tRNA ligase [Candidatus Peregrinibacteria bacterium]
MAKAVDKHDAMRHSCSHVMAQAIMDMFPEAKLAVGPWIDSGFYHDFELPRTLIPEDLPILEKKMKQIMKQRQKFVRFELPVDEGIEYLKERGQDYTAEMAVDLKNGKEVGTLSFYENIIQQNDKKTFVNMCAGPHTDNTGEIGVFKLMKIAGSYFKGDSDRPMLQRIYGACFETQDELNAHLTMLREQEKRDHRKLGKDLELYTMSEEVGAGLPLWLPNGTVIVEEIEKLAKEVEFEAGYDRVRTPHITKGSLYHKSGHLPYYADSMYPPMEMDNEEYYLKPMNCPHHHLIYDAKPRSYRDLPVRLAEYGHCYRFEDSGALFGLMRVRSMCMNDAHIYCTLEQFEEEFLAVLEIYKKYFELFGIDKYMMRLSLHNKEGLGKKYVDNPKLWIETEEMVRKAMKKSGVNYEEVPGEAAFYGPKIDVEIWSAIGRQFTLATNQLDFAIPKRFNLTYTDKDGEEKTPLCIHRAPLSTHERLVGFLIEHFAGAFPVWLAPEQVRLMPVADPHAEYAMELMDELKKKGVRATIEGPENSLGKRIREAEKKKIPYMLVIGDEEMKGWKKGDGTKNGSVTVRDYKTKEQKSTKASSFVKKVIKEIEERAL